jgi:hypothetical protein
MKKGLLFICVLVVSINATTLSSISKNAEDMYSYEEFNKNNFYKIKKNSNLRSSPAIKKNNIVSKSGSDEYLLSNCGANWCMIVDSGLWVHQSRIIK